MSASATAIRLPIICCHAELIARIRASPKKVGEAKHSGKLIQLGLHHLIIELEKRFQT
jgi:hypothetical protein